MKIGSFCQTYKGQKRKKYNLIASKAIIEKRIIE